MLDHSNVKEVIAESIDKFNAMLEQVGSEKRLSDDEDQFQENYLLYVARKNGLPKDDLPGKSAWTQLMMACRVFTEHGDQVAEVPEVRFVHIHYGYCAGEVQATTKNRQRFLAQWV